MRSPAVHPRVCGEHAVDRVLGVGHVRFIPACAGNTRTAPSPTLPPPVHPRVCGEHPRATSAEAWEDRFIPACAGNTRPPQVASSTSTGSSPRVRGTPNSPRTSIMSHTVHPRVCREHPVTVPLSMVECGSSPRVRGTRSRVRVHIRANRFIPACAGNTSVSAMSTSTTPVHPRVCGEHAWDPVGVACCSGSSPRVRGTRPARLLHRLPQHGSSPRVRGTPGPRRPRRGRRAVHPRVCGEHAAT